ncbi:MAG: hypothetical protein IJ415_00770, partial [Clostridia bacterium]|nr:hypothetical protein [Clostridia bacterium]
MKESILMKQLLNSHFLCIDASEHRSKFFRDYKKQREKLKSMLNESQYKLVKSLIGNYDCHMFHIRDIECFKMLYLGIKLGMEIA